MNTTTEPQVDRPVSVRAARKRRTDRRVDDLEQALTKSLDTIEAMKVRIAQLEVYRPPLVNRSMVVEAISAEVRNGEVLDTITNRITARIVSDGSGSIQSAIEQVRSDVHDGLRGINIRSDSFHPIMEVLTSGVADQVASLVSSTLTTRWASAIESIEVEGTGSRGLGPKIRAMATQILDRMFVDRVLSRIPQGAGPELPFRAPTHRDDGWGDLDDPPGGDRA